MNFFLKKISVEEKHKFEGIFGVPICSLNNIDTTTEKMERKYRKKSSENQDPEEGNILAKKRRK